MNVEVTEEKDYITVEHKWEGGDYDYDWSLNFSCGEIEFCVDDSNGGTKEVVLTEENTKKVFEMMKKYFI